MTTMELILALIAAVRLNDQAATIAILDELETRMPPAELADVLEAVVGGGEGPVLVA